MEGMDTSNVTPDSASDVSSDQGQEFEGQDQSAVSNDTGSKGKAAPTQGEQAKIKAQIRELGDADLDALVKIKVNGVEKKVSVRDAIKISQLEQASHQKMQQAAQMQRQFHEFARQAKENPDLFFQQFGLDPDAYSEARLAKKLEQMSLTPEQKKAQEMESRLKRYEEQERQAKEREETDKRSKEEQRYAAQLDQEMTEAFKSAGLPKDPFYVQLMAAEMLGAQRRGQDITAQAAAAKVKQKFTTHVNSILGGMDPQSILSFLGDPVRKMIREAELRRVTDKAPPSIDSGQSTPRSAQNAGAQSKTGGKSRKVLNEREFREWLKSR